MNTVDDYNVLLDNDRGQRVLANMLLEGGFFKHNKTSEEQAVQNFLKSVLAKTGRYPIDGYPDEDNAFAKVVSFVSGFQKRRTTMDFIKNLRRLKKEY